MPSENNIPTPIRRILDPNHTSVEGIVGGRIRKAAGKIPIIGALINYGDLIKDGGEAKEAAEIYLETLDGITADGQITRDEQLLLNEAEETVISETADLAGKLPLVGIPIEVVKTISQVSEEAKDNINREAHRQSMQEFAESVAVLRSCQQDDSCTIQELGLVEEDHPSPPSVPSSHSQQTKLTR